MLEFSNFTVFYPPPIRKKYRGLKLFGKVKIIFKNPRKSRLVTYRLIVYALTRCATLFGNNCERKILKLYLSDFIVYFDSRYVTLYRCRITPS